MTHLLHTSTRALLLLTAAATTTAACQGTPPPATTAQSTANEHTQLDQPAAAPVDPRVEEFLRWLRSVRDPRRMALFQPPESATPWRKVPKEEVLRTAATADVYIFGYDNPRGLVEGGYLDQTVHGCGASTAVTDSGALCPSTIRTGVTVEGESLKKLWSEFEQPSTKMTLDSIFPHVSFVFRDETGAPVWEYLVAKYKFQERHGGDDGPRFGDGRGQYVRELCRAAGDTYGCGLEDDLEDALKDLLARQRVVDGDQIFRARRFDLEVPVAASRHLNEISTREQRLLCSWFVQTVPIGVVNVGSTYACNSADRWAIAGFNECTSNFPRCSQTVGDIAPCVRSFLARTCKEPVSRGCTNLRECMWGIQTPFDEPSPNDPR